MKRVLIIDNYDSFSYNLYQLVSKFEGVDITMALNDEMTIEEISNFEYIIISPGPGLPSEAGVIKEVIQLLGSTHKILGVCLGLQAIGEVYGAELKQLDRVYHGIQSEVRVTNSKSVLFSNMSSPFLAGRYHSWVVDSSDLGDSLLLSAIDEHDHVMALRHSKYSVFGVQFHPESIMTPLGKEIIRNFLNLD